MSETQIPMPLGHETQYTRDSYIITGTNRPTMELLNRWPDWPTFFIALDGPRGSGKTHLAKIWCQQSGAAEVSSDQLGKAAQAVASGAPGICVDGLQEDKFDQADLFHVINGVRESGSFLLITSRTPIPAWKIELPDLKSRLRLASPVSLPVPDDELLRQVLVKLFSDRQLDVHKNAIDYVLLRMERSLTAAGDFVARADRAALSELSPVTRRLAARVLEEMAAEADE